jgi:tripartite-type tricarboxylate transporter receptor subunit TctC
MKHRMHVMTVTAVVLTMWTGAAGAQAPYPVKPIRFLVGFPPGGSNDIVARVLAPKLSEGLGQQVVVDNRGGANTAIATQLMVNSPPDGYTILMNAPGHATNPALIKLGYDSINDFAFITLLAKAPNLLSVHPSFPPKTVKELIALSKRRPGEVNYGSSGIGTSVHLSAELFQYMTGVKWTHVAYRGGGPGLVALLAGEVSLYFGNLPTMFRQVQAGKLRGIAVSSTKRAAAAPQYPTIDESGVPGYEVSTWWGISAPAATPPAVLERLHKEIVAALRSPAVSSQLEKLGAELVGNSREEYAAYIRNEIAKWDKVIKAAGIKGQ